MRAKLCKQLRKHARAITLGAPERRLLTQVFLKKVTVTNPKHPEFGKTISVRIPRIINDPKSARGAYRLLKMFVKKGNFYA